VKIKRLVIWTYAAFGNKEKLFRRALDRCVQQLTNFWNEARRNYRIKWPDRRDGIPRFEHDVYHGDCIRPSKLCYKPRSYSPQITAQRILLSAFPKRSKTLRDEELGAMAPIGSDCYTNHGAAMPSAVANNWLVITPSHRRLVNPSSQDGRAAASTETPSNIARTA